MEPKTKAESIFIVIALVIVMVSIICPTLVALTR